MFVNVNDDTAILFERDGEKVSCVILDPGDNPQDVLVENMLAGIDVPVDLELMVGHGFTQEDVSMFHVLKMENVDGSRWGGYSFYEAAVVRAVFGVVNPDCDMRILFNGQVS